ncbi:hypothetical protein C8N46_108152 [Kordia periserrulae]|uniref:Uncharacterized protein n=1 Tax=Kordia periserrulae TaxID=701523 RepID=A0A2T6BUT1_9FLAO|nr:hypothetical protein [Kordia periserrulae]PTX59839.1 hypothetical protein C8N46_108152 [Kordia periserrulae]
MKKKSLKSLQLTKKTMSNFNKNTIKGGRVTFNCTARTMSGCW